MNASLITGLGLALCFSGSVSAETQDKGYDASIALGYVATSGNTKTQTYNTEFLVNFETYHWDHHLKLQALGSSEDSETTAERYYLENKSDYKLDAMQYLFGKISYTDDRFSGYNYQTSTSAGYGRYLLKDQIFSLQAYGGLGYRGTDNDTVGHDGEMIVTLGESLSWAISESSSLKQSLSSEVGAELTVTVFEIALESVIVGDIISKIGFQARSNSQVPEGTKKTDTQTSISLSYAF